MNEEVEKLVAAGKLSGSVGEKLSQLEVGTFCNHKSWGVGRVSAWDLIGGGMTIDFEDKPGHGMKLEFAAKSLDVLAPDHILSRRLADLEGLSKQAEEDPVSLVKQILECHGMQMSLDEFDSVVKGRIVTEGKFKSWWDNAKKLLRKQPAFVVPSKRNLPLELRDAGMSPAESLIASVNEVRDLKAKAKAVSTLVKEIEAFSEPAQELAELSVHLEESISKSMRIKPGQSLELLFARDDLFEKVPELKAEGQTTSGAMLKDSQTKLAEVVRALGVTGQRKLIEALPEAFGDGWIDVALNQMNSGTVRVVAEIARFLEEKGHREGLMTFLKKGLGQRSLSSEVLAWVCKERKKSTQEVVSGELCSALINALEKEHYADDSKKSNRLKDVLEKDAALLGDLASISDKTQMKTVARRILTSPVFDDLTSKSLVARIIAVQPEVREVLEGDVRGAVEIKDESLIVSYESLETRQKELEHLRTVEIPKNREEVKIAREHGDLRENSEYKMAKEQESVLQRREIETEAELDRARGTDFKGVDTSAAAIGTIVELQDVDTGESETYTILGAWDTDLDKSIVSYLSGLAQALIGNSVGDELAIPSDSVAGERQVRVVSISAYAS